MFKDHKNLSCADGERMIDYLYGEISRSEKIKYEAHLNECAECAAELADLGFARASIREWKQADFSNLETPIFDASLIKPVESEISNKVPGKADGWFVGLKKYLSFNPGLAGAALAAIVVCVGAALLALSLAGSRNNDVAKKTGNVNSSPKTAVAPTVETNSTAVPETIESADNQSPALPKTAVAPQTSPRENQTLPNKTAVKISSDAPKKNKADASVRQPKVVNDNAKKSPPVQKRRVPNINDAEDEEDETIRLADLFAELDTK